MQVETEALVLRRYDYSETSQIGHLYTPADGRISVLAKGIKKPNPALKGPMDLFQLARIRYRRRRSSDLGLLVRYEPITGFPALRRDLERAYAAFYLTEMVAVGTRENDPDPGIFRLLAMSLAALSDASPAAGKAVVVSAELGFLRASGFLPAWDRCARCGSEPLPAAARFYPRAGGPLCSGCPPERGGSLPLTAGTRVLLEALVQAGPRHAARVRISRAQDAELRTLLRAFFQEVLERPLHSEPFVRDRYHGFAAGVAPRSFRRAPVDAPSRRS